MRNRWAQSFLRIVAAALFNLASIAVAASPAQDRHVVVVVWDGMRPDFVSEQNTPALWKLAQSGVTFRNHHSVFPSATIVNGTAINTGVYPNRSGILANHDYQPKVSRESPIDVENARVVRKGDELSGGNYIAVSTIAELIHKAGGKTAIATAKTVGLLFDRRAESRSGQNIFAGNSEPPKAVTKVVKMLGAFPPATQAADRDTWTTKALTDVLWGSEIPLFSLLWLSEPDDTEHKTAPGAPPAIAAIKFSDQNLARVVAALDRHNATSTTDIFIVSDHGFSTIARSIDVPTILRDAGFDAVTTFRNKPKNGQIMIVGNGGMVLFYLIEHDAAVTRRLVEFLQQTDFAGVILTRDPMEGTFTFDKAKIDPPSLGYGAARNEHAPDVEMSFRWTEDKNQFDTAGMIDGDWQRAAGKGTHATLSKFDMHNMLIAAGPDFRHGGPDLTASGNVDLAPTILQILGIKSSSPMDGRILIEAMMPAEVQALSTTTETIEATKKFPTGTWRQYLKVSRAGSTVYLDEGNGAFTR